ncbi:3-oxoacyl-[acyl-carrier-protein] synthase III C-terminal domain-containing protein [Mycobacterium sp. 141]|uniref:3-oxoacyl-[acyl-carrier-protein] synthase III C-terminal domain-containing protein n=1 Tax=Mycobacterium sp. 141 TaxID=1120797 RepID=UPI00037672FB|nr:3-oxoacyl-[acyl-carrier-protein] synthase III C-terminal domain-containing protein [Mycobacterium sp. 141]
MGTVIEATALTSGRHWRDRHSALRLAVRAAEDCLHSAGREASDVDLLINTGIYRDRNLGEPALAAMIQQDIGAHPEDPHPQAHGTFSFDVANGSCGILTALQIVDGFLSAHVIDRALIVASDADPGHRLSEDFPFAPAGAALLCRWSDDDEGVGLVQWTSICDEGESFSATVGQGNRNVLRVSERGVMDERFAAAAAQSATRCIDAAALDIAEIDAIVAAPARDQFRSLLAEHLMVPEGTIFTADDEHSHTAALAGAFERAVGVVGPGDRILMVAAGAGVTAGATLYRMPHEALAN